MAFKWIHCRYCANTLHIDSYPLEEHADLKRSGRGVCMGCINAGHDEPSLIVTHGSPFIEYLLGKLNEAS